MLTKKPLYQFENALFCLDWIGCVRSVAVLAGNNERDVFSVADVNYYHPLHQTTHFFIIPIILCVIHDGSEDTYVSLLMNKILVLSHTI